MKSFIPYDNLVENALRGVVETVLRQVARDGIPGDHHFYITFNTQDPHVTLPDYIREKYPTDMTIVLQYQYSDLVVSDEGFSVVLSFNNIPETLKIPFRSITGFADPFVKFGLQFHLLDIAEDNTVTIRQPKKPKKLKEEKSDNVISLDKFRQKSDD